MTRVLMGDFSALHRAGLEDILRGDGIEVVATGPGGVLAGLVELLPDVIVLDLDLADTPALVDRIVHEYPRVKVLACSAEQPTMRVYPPLHYGESYQRELDPAQLTNAIRT